MGFDSLSFLRTSRNEGLFPRQANDATLVGFDLKEYRKTELCSAIAYQEIGVSFKLAPRQC